MDERRKQSGIACAVAQRRECGACREAPVVQQLEQKDCAKSQKMRLKGDLRKDCNRFCILAEEYDFHCIINGK